MKTIKLLESIGIDVRALASGINGGGTGGTGGSTSIFEILNKVSDALKLVGLTITDVVQMLEDSGITLQDLMEVINYVNSTPTAPSAAAASVDTDAAMSDEAKAAVFLMKQYELTLANWFMMAGYDVNYNEWGW